MPDDAPAGDPPAPRTAGGRPVGPRSRADSARLAAEALARVKAAARARGDRPSAGPRPGSPSGPPAGPTPSGPSPSGPSLPEAEEAPGAAAPRRGGAAPRTGPARARRDDPQPLRAALSGLLGDQGWRMAAAVGSVFGRWDKIVGPDLAAHTRPDTFADGELVVVADSTAWATQVRLLAANLVRRLNEELGDGAVRRVAVRGPAPPRRSGPWRVRDGRGPRDDYG